MRKHFRNDFFEKIMYMKISFILLSSLFFKSINVLVYNQVVLQDLVNPYFNVCNVLT